MPRGYFKDNTQLVNHIEIEPGGRKNKGAISLMNTFQAIIRPHGSIPIPFSKICLQSLPENEPSWSLSKNGFSSSVHFHFYKTGMSLALYHWVYSTEFIVA